VTGKRLCLKETSRAIRNFTQKVRWAWHLSRKTDSGNAGEKPLAPRDPWARKDEFPPEVEGFTYAAKQLVLKEYLKANRRISRGGKGALNHPAFARHAMGLPRKNDFAVWPSDKDGMFVLIHKAGVKHMVQDGMSVVHHRPVAEDTTCRMLPLIRRRAYKLRSRIDELGFKKAANECSVALENMTAKSLVASITCTIKTQTGR
jgi:hypothetical protein